MQKEYAKFKVLLNESSRDMSNKYNPSNSMISEVFAIMMVGILKILNQKAEEAGFEYLPTVFVVSKMQKYMFIDYVLKGLLYPSKDIGDSFAQSRKFNELVEVIADKSLKGGINVDNLHEYDDGENLLYVANLSNDYETRKEFWKQKLRNLFVNSNKQWLLDQYKFCKWFLFKNSHDMNINDVPAKIFEIDKVFENFFDHLKMKAGAKLMMNIKNLKEEEEAKEKEDLQVSTKMLYIKSLVLEFIVGEDEIGQLCLSNTIMNGQENTLTHAQSKVLKAKSQTLLKRFVSCSFSTNYKAVERYIE